MLTRKLGAAELIKATIARLSADALTSGYAVYDEVPDTATMPYVRVSVPTGVRSVKFGSRDYAVEENIIMIDVWSDYHGSKEAANYMNNITQAMTSTALSITDYSAPKQILMEFAELMRDNTDPTDIKRHGVMRFSIHMDPT